MNLYNGLTGIGMRGAHDDHQGFVEGPCLGFLGARLTVEKPGR
jgi:hypothetical protein